MYTVLALVIGLMFGAGIYLMMRRSIVKLAIGLVLVGQSAMLLMFTISGLVRARPPIVTEAEGQAVAMRADPLPQALVLTAIVISFAVLAFMLVLVYRVYQVCQSDDLNEIRAPEV